MPMLADEWFQFCRRYYTDRTIQHYIWVLSEFKRFSNEQFTVQSIGAYIDYLLQKNKRRTANNRLTVLKSYGRWYNQHYHTDNPAAKVKLLKEDQPQQRVIEPDEYQKILLVAKGVDRDIIVFLGNTGLRKSEFRALTWDKISADMRYVYLQGKGRRSRLVPLNQTCRDILAHYRDGSNGLASFTQRYYGREGIYWLCKKLARQAGINCFGPQALRHFFATRLLRQNVPLIKVSKILGHASIKTTEQVYLHFLPDDVLGLTDNLAN